MCRALLGQEKSSTPQSQRRRPGRGAPTSGLCALPGGGCLSWNPNGADWVIVGQPGGRTIKIKTIALTIMAKDEACAVGTPVHGDVVPTELSNPPRGQPVRALEK